MISKSNESVIRARRSLGFAAAALLAAACGGEGPDVGQPSPEELSGVNGQLAGSFVQQAVQARDFAPKWDGTDDPQLQAALRLSGAYRAVAFETDDAAAEIRDFESVKSHARTAITAKHEIQDPESIQPRASTVTSQQVDIAEREYVGLVTAKGHYRLEFDSASLQAKFKGKLLNEGGSVEPRGWSSGSDQRTRRTGANVPITQGRVTTAVGICSGASVGRRLVRTAGHCVVTHTTGGGTPVASATYEQARDGTVVRATDTTNVIFFGGNYIGRGCGTRTAADQNSGFRANLANCVLEDWAILVLSDDWHSEAGGTSWLGFSTLAGDEVGTDLESHGYPVCDDFVSGGMNQEGPIVHDPAGCRTVPRSNYRDVSARCELASFLSGTTSWRTGCDASPGNSGGPAIVRNTGNFLGNASWEDCGTCSAGNHSPNRYMGHNQFLFDFQSQLEEDNP